MDDQPQFRKVSTNYEVVVPGVGNKPVNVFVEVSDDGSTTLRGTKTGDPKTYRFVGSDPAMIAAIGRSLIAVAELVTFQQKAGN